MAVRAAIGSTYAYNSKKVSRTEKLLQLIRKPIVQRTFVQNFIEFVESASGGMKMSNMATVGHVTRVDRP